MGSNRVPRAFTGSTWLCFSSMVIVLVMISRFILNVAWLPFWIMESFISEFSSKLSLEGQPWVRILSNVSSVSLVDMRWNILQDLGNVSAFSNVLALDIPDYHSRVQRVIDSTGGCHVHSGSGRLDFCLFHIAKSWFTQCTEMQHFQFGDVTDHFSVQRIDFGEVHDNFICQKVLRRLEELDNYVIELQVLDPILVIRARLHHATANELQKWYGSL